MTCIMFDEGWCLINGSHFGLGLTWPLHLPYINEIGKCQLCNYFVLGSGYHYVSQVCSLFGKFLSKFWLCYGSCGTIIGLEGLTIDHKFKIQSAQS